MKDNVTKRIAPESFQKLLEKAVVRYGLPSCYEELVIYLDAQDSTESMKIVVRSTSGAELVVVKENQRSITIPFESAHIKKVLSLVSHGTQIRGIVSISPVYEFIDHVRGENIRFLKTSLQGPIIIFSDKENEDDLGQIDESSIGTAEQTKVESEVVINYVVSPTGILNSKILTYLEENGVSLSQERKLLYREVMENRSNNYESYEDIFKAVTHMELIGKDSLPKDKIERFDVGSTKMSVIIPCYNSEASIRPVLDAIAKQETVLPFENLEVVLIDDCSVRSIQETIKHTAYPFAVQVIRLEKNVGASTARHIGAVYASGSILIFLDSDIVIPNNYIDEHLVRNMVIPNAVFISFKENVPDLEKIDLSKTPDYSRDLRIHKTVRKDATGSYAVSADMQIEILESTNYFKSFSGSRVFGVYDLSCMVVGHNFSIRKKTLLEASPFSKEFVGWGMEDVFLGLKLICKGNFIIPILSTGVYHLDHPPRSGSEEKKQEQYEMNTVKINKLLDSPVW